ncbi:MAG TPA: dTMP kinase [Rickettsiales bacterium]|nr:dTMP kinase [Rickettsiales bacterium]
MTNLQKLKGKFITFEGVEGAGKSTQSKLLVEYLNNNGIEAVWTREPGGCEGAEEIRKIIISGSVNKWDGITELLLMYAARRDHTEKKIKPLLAEGKVVVSDRYFDSTIAYQGYGHQLDLSKIKAVQKVVLENFKPDITIILDLNVQEGLNRTISRGNTNRFEEMDLDFHKRVRDGFKNIAEEEKERVKLINVEGKSITELQKEIINNLNIYSQTSFT